MASVARSVPLLQTLLEGLDAVSRDDYQEIRAADQRTCRVAQDETTSD